jgi:cAMP-binding proteins - catabolite gene activator and regulatory subunit of cAMP-dependent protein kinases
MSIDEALNDAVPLEHIRFAATERIFSQGDVGEAAYVVVEGHVTLFQHHDGQRIEIGTVAPGEIFGEMAVLDGGRRSASAVAAVDCLLARVPQTVFRRRLDGADPFLKALVELFIKNIRSSHKLFLRRPRSFRDHVKQMSVFSWNLRRFAGRLHDTAMADDVLDILDRLDAAVHDLSTIVDLIPDKRHDLVAEEELHGVDFSDVVGTEGRRKI